MIPILFLAGVGGFIYFSAKNATPKPQAGTVQAGIAVQKPESYELIQTNVPITEAAFNQQPSQFAPAFSTQGVTDDESVDATRLEILLNQPRPTRTRRA